MTVSLNAPDRPRKIAGQPPPRAFLIFDGRIFHLDRSEINIGRGLGNELMINEPSVSRKHAKLVAENGRFIFMDQNSTCGSHINGQPVQSRMLNSGDIITLADVTLLYVEDSAGLPGTAWEETRPLS